MKYCSSWNSSTGALSLKWCSGRGGGAEENEKSRRDRGAHAVSYLINHLAAVSDTNGSEPPFLFHLSSPPFLPPSVPAPPSPAHPHLAAVSSAAMPS